MMERWRRIAVAIAVAGAGCLALAAPAQAGDAYGLFVDVYVEGTDAPSVRDGLGIEVYELPGGEALAANCQALTQDEADSFTAVQQYGCDIPAQSGPDYAVGITGVPDGFVAVAGCSDGPPPVERIDGPGAEFSFYGLGTAQCDIVVRQPILVLDKVVVGTDEPLAADQFTMEIFAAGSLETTAVDPSDAVCDDWADVDAGDCVAVPLSVGEFTLGEEPVTGYEYAGIQCGPAYRGGDGQPGEAFADASAIVDLTETDIYCRIENTYAEGQLVVSASVNNDDGGTAGVEDVSIEVYEDGVETPVVAATACAADGSCLDMMLPVGDYVIGYEGPDGYTREIMQSVTAPTTTTTEPEIEAIVTDDPDAEFTVENGGLVEIEVAIDDPEPEPTTTTTEPATTTTAFDAGAGTLPPTGASSETNTTIAVVAFALIAAGLALVGVRRRTA